MIASSLMARATQILRSRAGTAAMVIVPLAMAVPGRADSVQFTVGDLFITGASGGGTPDGHIYGTQADVYQGVPLAGGVLLTGDTMVDGAYLTAQQNYDNLGVIRFTWTGGFTSLNGNSNVSVGDILSVAFCNDIENAFDAAPGTDTFGKVNWSLDVYVYNSSTNQDSNTLMAAFDTGGSGFGTSLRSPPVPPDSTFTVGGEPMFWTAQLSVFWQSVADGVNPADQISVKPSIDLAIPSSPAGGGGGATSTPLPSAVWAGGAMMAGLWGLQIRQRRNHRRIT